MARGAGILILLMVLATSTGCSLKKSLPEGKYLYTGSKVRIVKTDKTADYAKLRSEASDVIDKPRPNRKFLGMKMSLGWYNLWQNNKSKKKKGFAKWVQKSIGEEPVVYDDRIRVRAEEILKNRVQNNGFFTGEVSSEVIYKKRKAWAEYVIKPLSPHIVKSVEYQITDSLLSPIVSSLKDSSLVIPGENYQLSALKKERERITSHLKTVGYYFFNDDFLFFLADTTKGDHEVTLELELKKGLTSRFTKPQHLSKIYVYPDFDINAPKIDEPKDTLEYNGLTFIYHSMPVKPKELDNAINLSQGDLYSSKDHRQLFNRLLFLKTYKFINIDFASSPSSDSLIDASIFLTPRKKQTIEGALGLSFRSSIYLGPELSLSYINRNLFKGAEYFEFSTLGNFNLPLKEGFASYQEVKFDLHLSKTGLLLPLRKKRWSDNLIERSKLDIEYTLDNAKIPLKGSEQLLEDNELFELLGKLESDSTFSPTFAINSIDWSFGYQWYKKPYLRHEINPIKFIFQFPKFEEPELLEFFFVGGFIDDSDGGGLLNVSKMFIFQPEYRLVFDSRLKKTRVNSFSYLGKVSVSGNKVLSENPVVPVEFLEGQFVQLENDLRYYYNPFQKTTFASRFAVKFMLPFSENAVPPFFDQYSLGGPYSIRAFAPRRVGPGRIEPSDQTFFFTGKGDVSIEGSLEFRQKISGIFELGFFMDYGNIWLINDFTGDGSGQFSFDTFYEEIALGTGAGFRLDFDVLILRLDFAIPLTKPWLPKGQRWVGNQINFRSPEWRKENLTFNLAFGHAF